MHGVVASLFHALNKILQAADVPNIKYRTDAVQLKQELDEAVTHYFLHEKDSDDISMNMYRTHLETIKSRIDSLTKRLVSHANSPGPYVRPNVNQDMDVDNPTSRYQESGAIPLSTQPTYNTQPTQPMHNTQPTQPMYNTQPTQPMHNTLLQPTQLPITQPTYNAQFPMSTGMGQPSSSNTVPLDYDMADAEPQNGWLGQAKAATQVVFETVEKFKQLRQNAEDAAKQAKASLAEATEANREAEKAMKDVEKEAKREEDARLKLQKAEEKLDAAQRATAERAVQAAQKEASKKANEAEKQAAREAREAAKRMEEEARNEANAMKLDLAAQEKAAKNAKMSLDNAKKIERGAKEKAAKDANAAVEKAEKKLTALTVEFQNVYARAQQADIKAQQLNEEAKQLSIVYQTRVEEEMKARVEYEKANAINAAVTMQTPKQTVAEVKQSAKFANDVLKASIIATGKAKGFAEKAEVRAAAAERKYNVIYQTYLEKEEELRAYENAVQILKVEAQKARQAAGEASGSQPKMVGAHQVLYI
jgi:hypothetical protein